MNKVQQAEYSETGSEKVCSCGCKCGCSEEAEADQGIHEECGVFGMYDFDGEDVASTIYYGLFALQHRGQESAGIAVCDTEGPVGDALIHKDKGLANEVFNAENLATLYGNLGIGHVRYPSEGTAKKENAQPLLVNYVKGILGVAHNGSILNCKELRESMAESGAIYQTTGDAEVIGYLIARERLHTDSVEGAILNACKKLKGAYSMAIMSPRKLIGVRDPHGYRPLCIGKRDNAYFLSSETCALDTIDAEFVRDVKPGEIVTITPEGGIESNMDLAIEKAASCIFEYIYFARPDSVIDGVGVYGARVESGRILARRHPVEADLVVGVPSSGSPAGLGYALESGIPHGNGFIKNSYVGRTFIKPKQSQRETAVKIKLNVLKEAVAGKRVVMVDDSIVRGTTCARIVKMLRAAGAKEVHVRISSPLFIYPCFYGTDIPSQEHLVAHNRTVEEIREIIGADSLGFMEVEDLPPIVKNKIDFCDACFTGNFPELPEGFKGFD